MWARYVRGCCSWDACGHSVCSSCQTLNIGSSESCDIVISIAQMGKVLADSVNELIVIVGIPNAVEIRAVLHELGLPAERQRENVPDHSRFRMIWGK